MKLPSRSIWILPLALVVLAAAVVAERRLVSGPALPNVAESPEECMAGLIEAEKRGDLSAYFDRFAPTYREEMIAKWGDQSADEVSRALRERSEQLVGHVVIDVEVGEPAGHASLVLERIERGRTQRQRVMLVRIAGRWKIDELTAGDVQAQPIPYGTPVVEKTKN